MTSRPALLPTRASRVGLLLVLLIGLLSLPAGPASAHDELISTQPAADAVLDAAPVELALEFSADVLNVSQAIVPTIVLTGPSGEVPLAAPTVDGPRVSVPVPVDLAPGTYTVIWRIVSADGHPVQGTFGFSLTAPPTPTPTRTATPAPSATEVGPSSAPSPEPTAGDTSGDTTGDTTRTFGLVAGLAALAAAAAAVIARRRR